MRLRRFTDCETRYCNKSELRMEIGRDAHVHMMHAHSRAFMFEQIIKPSLLSPNLIFVSYKQGKNWQHASKRDRKSVV